MRAALVDLRATVATLRAAPEEGMALEVALPRLLEEFQFFSELMYELHVPNPMPDLSPAHRHAFYRAAQEGLTNIQKHAQASKVSVSLAQEGNSWVLRVKDDGRGPQASCEAPGFGLLGLRERAELLGGTVKLDAVKSGGSVLIVALPVEKH